MENKKIREENKKIMEEYEKKLELGEVLEEPVLYIVLLVWYIHFWKDGPNNFLA